MCVNIYLNFVWQFQSVTSKLFSINMCNKLNSCYYSHGSIVRLRDDIQLTMKLAACLHTYINQIFALTHKEISIE